MKNNAYIFVGCRKNTTRKFCVAIVDSKIVC